MLEIHGLCKSFGGAQAVCHVWLAGQQIIGLIGPNGAGKTTLFDLITGFQQPDSGTVRLDGQLITGLAPNQIARNGLSRTFQNLRLIREISVQDNVILSLQRQDNVGLVNTLAPWKYLARDRKLRKDAGAILELVGLQNHAEVKARELSFGQQQLLALATCFATRAKWLLLDEPVAGVSPTMIDSIGGFLRKAVDQGVTVLLIEHNLSFVKTYADHAVAMDAGRIIAGGQVQSVLSDAKVGESYIA